MRHVQGKAGKSSQGVGVTEVPASLQHGSGKEDQGPDMRLLPAVSSAALCLHLDPSCLWLGYGEEIAQPGGTVRVMKLVQNGVASNGQ